MKKVSIITGYACNNNCVFCYNSGKRGYPDLTTGEIKKRLTGLKKAGCEHVNFSGGEFTIRKDALEIIAFAKKLGFKVIEIITNGRMLSYLAIARKFVENGANSIIYSIYGDDASLHDSLTKSEGSFEQITKAIENTKKLGMPFFANVLIVKQNYKRLPKIAEFLAKAGCASCSFIYVNPIGAAYDKFDEIVPLISEAAPYIKKAIDIGIKNNIKDWKISGVPLCFLEGYDNNIFWDNVFSDSMVKSLSCVDCKYFDGCNGLYKAYAEKKGVKELRPVKDLPEEVIIELISSCNKDCSFCFNKNPTKGENKLTKDVLFGLLDKIAGQGVKAVRFTGGEPLLRDDIEEILRYAKEKGLYTILNTNGILLTKENIFLLGYIDDLLISFHDINEVEEKKRLLDITGKSKVFLRFCTIATKENIVNLEEFYKFLDKQKINDWFLLRPIPNRNDLNPVTRRDIASLTEKILELNEKYSIKTRIANSVPFCAYDKEKVNEICAGGVYDGGHSRIVVSSDGSIREDYFSDFCLGNIFKDELIDCWNSEYMHKKRKLKDLPQQCLNCDYKNKCMAGLEFAARINNADIDPLAKKDFRILLVNPKYEGFNLPIEPLALEYIASFLESRGYDCRIIDCNLNSDVRNVVQTAPFRVQSFLSIQKTHKPHLVCGSTKSFFDINYLISAIKSFKPNLIGLSTFSLQIDNSYKIGNLIKKQFPEIYLAYGGVHSTFVYGTVDSTINPKEAFTKGSADFVISGEGEKPFLQLASALEKKDFVSLKVIAGVSYKKGKEIIINTQHNLADNLDELPFPARHLVNIKGYKNDIHILPYANETAVDIIASRGCPFNCNYCTSPALYGRKVRFRSPENVVAELNEIVNCYGIKNIHFHDDCFLFDRERARKICELIISRKLKINWICLASIKNLLKSEEILPIMRKAGCVGIEIGLESFDEAVLKSMNKNQREQDIFNVDKMLKKNEIYPLYLMISFYPGETLYTCHKNADLLNKLSNNKLKIVDYLKAVHLPYSFGQFATPYKGTEFEKIAKTEGISFIKSAGDYNRQKVNFIPYSFLRDIPARVKNLDEASFYKEIDKFRESIDYYLKDPELIGYSKYKEYTGLLYKIYSKVNGKETVQELIKSLNLDLCVGSLAFKFLAMFNLITSKSTLRQE